MNALKEGLPPLPRRIARLEVDPRGYPIPWFVDRTDGACDFRVADARKRVRAITEKLCYVCGDYLGVYKAFVIGPMCAINRVTAEPPCHQDCAEWSAIACPFMSRPKMKRRTNDLPEDGESPGGIPLDRNPGVTCIWTCGSFEPFNVDPSLGGGWLIQLGEPAGGVKWFAEGRTATRAEVEASIESGYPALLELALKQGQKAEDALAAARERAEKYYPVAA